MTWAAGIFNDWLETGADFTENARDFVGRVSGLAWESPDETKYVHVGVGLKRRGPDSGMMRFSGRPESNVTGKYEDTKDFPARGEWRCRPRPERPPRQHEAVALPGAVAVVTSCCCAVLWERRR